MRKQVFVFGVCAVLALGMATTVFAAEGDTCPVCHGKGMVPQGMRFPEMMPPLGQGCPEMIPQQGQGQRPEMEMGKMAGPGAKRGMMQTGRMAWMCPAPPQMMQSVTATSDGGVVVMIGNRLFKYDKDLKLTAKAEIKMDTECLPRMPERKMQ